MNTPSNFELKQIAESFFKEKGTFSVDNVLGLMSKAFQVGYEKGHIDGKYEKAVSNFKTISASDLKAAMDLKSASNPWDQWNCDSIIRNANKVSGLTTEPLSALSLKDLKTPEPCKEWLYPFYS